MNLIKLPDPEDLARDFAAGLFEVAASKHDRGETWLTMMDANRVYDEEGAGCCASQNFCDANMVMDACFEDLCGKSATFFDDSHPQQEAAHDVWNKAWEIARRRWLTAGK